jgi:hypothetical protein
MPRAEKALHLGLGPILSPSLPVITDSVGGKLEFLHHQLSTLQADEPLLIATKVRFLEAAYQAGRKSPLRLWEE